MRKVQIGNVRISGLCIGGNPFSGFSHQSPERSKEMAEYYTPEKIRETLAEAEQNGINTVFARTDDHIMGILADYWKEGGQIKWFAQVCREQDKPNVWRDWLRRAVDAGAVGAYIHGGLCDNWFGTGQYDCFYEALEKMRRDNVAAGFAGHRADLHAWIRDNFDVDFQMCSYYNPTDRTRNPMHKVSGEAWRDEDREEMLRVIPTIRKPVVHYKVLGAMNKPFVVSFERLRKTVRAHDVVCIGMFTKDKPDMIEEDVQLFQRFVDRRHRGGRS